MRPRTWELVAVDRPVLRQIVDDIREEHGCYLPVPAWLRPGCVTFLVSTPLGNAWFGWGRVVSVGAKFAHAYSGRLGEGPQLSPGGFYHHRFRVLP